MVPGYPKHLYRDDGSFVTVQNQHDEKEYADRGWNQSAPSKTAEPNAEPKAEPEPATPKASRR